MINDGEDATAAPQGKEVKDLLGFIFHDLQIPDESAAAGALESLREQKVRARNQKMIDYLERISDSAEIEKTSIRRARRAFDAHLNGRRRRMDELKALAQKVVDCDPETYENFSSKLAEITASGLSQDFRDVPRS